MWSGFAYSTKFANRGYTYQSNYNRLVVDLFFDDVPLLEHKNNMNKRRKYKKTKTNKL